MLEEKPEEAIMKKANRMLGYEVGVDEAGRGPVVGPMVYSALAWPTLSWANFNFVDENGESLMKGKKQGNSTRMYGNFKSDRMPIDLGNYYNTWKNIRNVYSRESQFDELRRKMLAEVFDDSKQLKEAQREDIYDRIRDCQRSGFLHFENRVISALEISELMTRDQPTNLNKISHETVVELIQKLLEKGLNVTRVFVDTVGPPSKYADFLRSRFPDSSRSPD